MMTTHRSQRWVVFFLAKIPLHIDKICIWSYDNTVWL